MHFKNIKQAYIYGLKEGMVIGVEKGMDIAESWVDCPPANNNMGVIENVPHNQPTESDSSE